MVSRVTCDVGYLYANFSLGLSSRVGPDVCDRQTDRRQTRQKYRLMPTPRYGGIISLVNLVPRFQSCIVRSGESHTSAYVTPINWKCLAIEHQVDEAICYIVIRSSRQHVRYQLLCFSHAHCNGILYGATKHAICSSRQYIITLIFNKCARLSARGSRPNSRSSRASIQVSTVASKSLTINDHPARNIA